MRKDIIPLKAGLLCFGASVEPETAKALAAEYPHFFDKGFIHAVNIRLYSANVNISVAENFSTESPYTLVKRDGAYRIVGGGYDEAISFFDRLPTTGTVVDELAMLHSEGCINIWPSTTCCYDTPEKKCRFCSLKAETKAPIGIPELCVGIRKLLAEVPETYMLNFSGGTYRNPDWMAGYWIDLAKEIRTFSDCNITVEFAPPSDFSLLAEMKKAGIGAAIMNLEIADPALRAEICPGKSGISYEHYYEAFGRAVELFGWGMVSSVLIGGIQPMEDIKAECKRMAEIGVYPTIMPFRPLDNCEYFGMKRCRPEELIEMSDYLSVLLYKNRLDYTKQEGCTKCGGCSLENDCFDRMN